MGSWDQSVSSLGTHLVLLLGGSFAMPPYPFTTPEVVTVVANVAPSRIILELGPQASKHLRACTNYLDMYSK